MPLSPISKLSDDEAFVTPPAKGRKSPETCPEEREVDPPVPKKIRLRKEPEEDESVKPSGDESVKPSSATADKPAMKRPASAKPVAKPKAAKSSEASLKRPASAKASSKAKAKAAGKKAKAEYAVSEGPVRAYKCMYKESKAWGIKIKDKNQVMQVSFRKGLTEEQHREIAEAARVAFEEKKTKAEVETLVETLQLEAVNKNSKEDPAAPSQQMECPAEIAVDPADDNEDGEEETGEHDVEVQVAEDPKDVD